MVSVAYGRHLCQHLGGREGGGEDDIQKSKDTHTCGLVLSLILIQIPLLHSPSHVPIMAKLALAALFASTGLEKFAQDHLGVHPKGHLLRLHGLEERGLLLPTLLLVGLLLRPQLLLPLLGERLARLSGRRGLRLHLGDLLLHLGRFIFLYFF